ncbi:MAG: hypothetical protein WCA77_02570 [Thermoplasmata archaeon]
MPLSTVPAMRRTYPMVEYSDEGVFPLARPALWKFLEMHTDSAAITQIHPDILQQELVSRADSAVVVDRRIRARKKQLTSRWKFTSQPPDLLRWEIIGGEGPMAPGSWLANTYSEAPGGTLVRTQGEVNILGVPGFLQRRIVRNAMHDIDHQDLGYVQYRTFTP